MLNSVLIVEDDKDIAESIKSLFLQNSIQAYSILDGQDIQRLLRLHNFDLILLDLMLPHKSGAQLCQEIKAVKDIPIIMISALKDSYERVNALELGADDFLDKPVEIEEIIARACRIITRKNSALQHEIETVSLYHFGGWSLEVNQMKLVSPSGLNIALTKQLYDILMLFVTHPKELLTRDYIARSLYDERYDSYDRSIDVAMSKLRKRLQENNKEGCIQTQYGKGYYLNVEVTKE